MSELKRVRENESAARAAKIAADAIDLFVEDRDRHGFDEKEARRRAIEDVSRGCDEALEPVIRRGWEGA